VSVFRALDSSAASRVFFDVSSTGCDVSSDILSPEAAGEHAVLLQKMIVREAFFCFEQQRRETNPVPARGLSQCAMPGAFTSFANCIAQLPVRNALPSSQLQPAGVIHWPQRCKVRLLRLPVCEDIIRDRKERIVSMDALGVKARFSFQQYDGMRRVHTVRPNSSIKNSHSLP
jgi:hypothetical protein